MKTINEVADDEIVFSPHGNMMYGYELKQEWNSQSIVERTGWKTAVPRKGKLSAKAVLAEIYRELEETGYDDMAERLWDETTDDIITRLQSVLDDIASFSSAVVYDLDEWIYADVEVE